VPQARLARQQPPHHGAFALGPTTLCDRFQRLDVEPLLGHVLFQAAILFFELLEPLHFAQLHPADFAFQR
jgi:hypothetical protein